MEKATISLNHRIIRTSKADSAYVYFQFEANEGLCFYSTLPESLGTPYRDIEIFSPQSLNQEFEHLLNYLGQEVSIETLINEVVQDDSSLVSKYVEKN